MFERTHRHDPTRFDRQAGHAVARGTLPKLPFPIFGRVPAVGIAATVACTGVASALDTRPASDDSIAHAVQLEVAPVIDPEPGILDALVAEAPDGTVLTLAPGAWTIENPSILAGRTLALRSADPLDPAILRAPDAGGRILDVSGGADLTFDAVRFEGGRAAGILPGEFGGGAILLRDSTARFLDCAFEGARADAITREGAGGAILAIDAHLVLVGGSFADARADLGGAIAVRRGSLSLQGTRFDAVHARSGAAIHLEDVDATIEGALVADASAEGLPGDPGAGALLVNRSDADQVRLLDVAFKGGSASGPVVLNDSLRPMVLQSVSICALPTVGIDGPWLDWGGNHRCELPADLDLDGRVGAGDLSVVLAYFGTVDDAEIPGDASGDGRVNGADLQLVLGHWGEDAGLDS